MSFLEFTLSMGHLCLCFQISAQNLASSFLSGQSSCQPALFNELGPCWTQQRKKRHQYPQNTKGSATNITKKYHCSTFANCGAFELLYQLRTSYIPHASELASVWRLASFRSDTLCQLWNDRSRACTSWSKVLALLLASIEKIRFLCSAPEMSMAWTFGSSSLPRSIVSESLIDEVCRARLTAFKRAFLSCRSLVWMNSI